MRFAVNYSEQGAHLWRNGSIQVDCFKCPAWPKLVNKLRGVYPLYVHFPLRVGMGIGDAINTETNEKPDWQILELMAAQTNTPFFNIHLAPIPEDHPEIPLNELGFKYSEQFTRVMVQDVSAVIERVGSGKVIAENIYSAWGVHPISAVIPEVVRDVIEETGCGLLLDISHARQAARELQMDPQQYIKKLPLHRLREVHITGIQIFNDFWIDKLHNAGISYIDYERYANQPIDHLPMQWQDWEFFQWALDNISQGHWNKPDIIAFEYSGIGKGFFKATTDTQVLAKQIPRLFDMVHNTQ